MGTVLEMRDGETAVSMNDSGEYRLELPGWKLENCRTRLSSGGGSEHSLAWRQAGKPAKGLDFACENELGRWRLEFRALERQGLSIRFSGKLLRPAPELRLVIAEIPALEVEHLVSQGVSMGGCHSLALPRAEAKNVSARMLTLRRGGSFLQLSFPMLQSQPESLECEASGRHLRQLAAMAELKHFDGTDVRPDPLELRSSADGFKLMESWAETNTEVRKDFSAPVPAGWNSWDYYRWTITEEEVLKNAELIARDPVLSKHVKRIIVDDGWQYCYGEWEANPLFPHGMAWLAKELTKLGFEPGLWIAPTVVEPHCRIAQTGHELLALGESGVPCLAYECMRRYGFVLDPTLPKVQTLLSELFTRYTAMGYKHFKLDFLGSTLKAPRFADASVPRSQIMRKIVEPIRAATLGKASLLGCNYHFEAGNRLVDAVRVAADIHATWEALRHNVIAIAARYWSNKRWWINDPDFALCRGFDTSDDPDLTRLLPCLVFNPPELRDTPPGVTAPLVDLRRPQLEILLSLVIAAGGAVNLSDNLCRLNASGLDLARRAVAAEPGDAAVPLDLFQAELPSTWLQRTAGGHRALLINWTDAPARFSLDLRSHGTAAANAVNFWDDQPLQLLEDGRLAAELPGRSCLMATLS